MQAYGFSKSRRARILRITNGMVRDFLLSVLTLALVVQHVVEWKVVHLVCVAWIGTELLGLQCWLIGTTSLPTSSSHSVPKGLIGLSVNLLVFLAPW